LTLVFTVAVLFAELVSLGTLTLAVLLKLGAQSGTPDVLIVIVAEAPGSSAPK